MLPGEIKDKKKITIYGVYKTNPRGSKIRKDTKVISQHFSRKEAESEILNLQKENPGTMYRISIIER